ncbi:helix-hairpin-helix domain-containing protein [Cyanobacterium aponinum FACHB-4101]|uniref:helix-hairpin-helix domain-containing protein n=1 Tax=Cyanobacterium aponinum TaxID=379064 RepID=UPI000C12E064|nr:helix-hairpin-helix domain-containing protein [Cyanobacterium aponinum]MBD2395326.1 helix-hairpin-helix domain-containing protein [Cyanobacterium aponinum FACHB-4101]PHV64088.1 hypothetical protein CSQ80_02245 [Cyanobacterium aponinum IPPAS B-1201]
MSNSNWFEKIPSWVWWSLTPYFGGFSFIYAGWKIKNNRWVLWGIAFIFGSIITGGFIGSFSNFLILIMPLIQLATAFKFKQEFLVKTAPKNILISSLEIAESIAKYRGKIDINNCSQDDLVYGLGLPIVYANDLQLLKEEGYMFTHLEELVDLVGIPEQILRRIEPLIIFTYDINKETDISWRRLNSLSIQELVSHGIDDVNAEKIVSERNQKGAYKSLLDVKKRTGIPINIYRHLV